MPLLLGQAVPFPDVVHAGIRVAKLGRSSVRYEIGLFANDDDSAATGRFVHVYVDRAANRPVPIRTASGACLKG